MENDGMRRREFPHPVGSEKSMSRRWAKSSELFFDGNDRVPVHFTSDRGIHIAPDPGLAGLNGANQWMFGRMKMLSGMLVLGGIAAADVTAGKT